MTSDEKINIINERKCGKALQYKVKPQWTTSLQKLGYIYTDDWQDLAAPGAHVVEFNFAMFEYRVKPVFIAGHPVQRLAGGLQIGCTKVTDAEVAAAYELTRKA